MKYSITTLNLFRKRIKGKQIKRKLLVIENRFLQNVPTYISSIKTCSYTTKLVCFFELVGIQLYQI